MLATPLAIMDELQEIENVTEVNGCFLLRANDNAIIESTIPLKINDDILWEIAVLRDTFAQFSDGIHHGSLKDITLEGDHGYIFIYTIPPNFILLAMGPKQINLPFLKIAMIDIIRRLKEKAIQHADELLTAPVKEFLAVGAGAQVPRLVTAPAVVQVSGSGVAAARAAAEARAAAAAAGTGRDTFTSKLPTHAIETPVKATPIPAEITAPVATPPPVEQPPVVEPAVPVPEPVVTPPPVEQPPVVEPAVPVPEPVVTPPPVEQPPVVEPAVPVPVPQPIEAQAPIESFTDVLRMINNIQTSDKVAVLTGIFDSLKSQLVRWTGVELSKNLDLLKDAILDKCGTSLALFDISRVARDFKNKNGRLEPPEVLAIRDRVNNWAQRIIK